MTLSEIKKQLENLDQIAFQLPNGGLVPSHFHVTEVGEVVKNFIDCGGTVRKETVANFQLWEANDYDHRLHPEKLVSIIELSERVLGLDENLEIEVEYQGETIQKYNLDIKEGVFQLTSKFTDCLAKDNCGIPQDKPKQNLRELTQPTNTCTPGSGCC
ncbi:hypothetical protein FNB79_13700 [Formosa sediminum]|uniref:Uncharacterized protein n=1 Tax=Formosa sediminum TaxID=2594004 RepID=A0A516GTY8_9FLAO|nr:DUF6428 family protein [Formosa sediminum]QDO94978.1 hypothetical protein FNB79_13700 [Formosa sediminum]